MAIKVRSVETGELTQREYTSDELAEIAVGVENDRSVKEVDDAFQVQKDSDNAALGTRAELIAEAEAANGVAQLRPVIIKMANALYSDVKQTID